MSIFTRRDPVTPEPAGVTALRRKVVACTAKPGVLHAVARDVAGAGLDNLQEFAAGKRDLKPEILQALARELFAAKLNEDGLLQSLNTAEPKPLCAANYPPKIDPKTSPYYSPPPRDHDAVLARMPQPVKPVPAKPKGPRPGWADGWI